MKAAFYIIVGYLCGSILFAKVIGGLLGKDVTDGTKDHNPGTANAFMQGGFWCGVLTLIGDIGKGAAPILLYLTRVPDGRSSYLFPLVLAAPVLGHIFPVFCHFKGGKGIATTFGCFLALLPVWRPLLSLIFFFLFYSVILRISPHYYRTLVTYLSVLAYLIVTVQDPMLLIGCGLITFAVTVRLFFSREEKKAFRVSLLWKR
ncbi:MAG: glycerol-3-phosphate acyltransferase [Eubacteriales bacterium]